MKIPCSDKEKEIARAAAIDAANTNMKNNNRTKWNRYDYNIAVVTYNKLSAMKTI